jgi:hypothetical protein
MLWYTLGLIPVSLAPVALGLLGGCSRSPSPTIFSLFLAMNVELIVLG